jgi:arylsulfatase A-like enzyme
MPTAGLLRDLKQRGLLDETLVVWAGEFGRTPMGEVRRGSSPGKEGRDHHPFAFSIWLAGGGVKRGYVHGRTDDFGYSVIESPVHAHDLQATILHLLGVDHERLTYRHSGRDFRLTDVHGEVVHGILA